MSMIKNLEQVNKELWLILALFLIGLFLNTTLGSNRMILGFYTIPTVVSAYLYGRRHATLTAVASVLFVSLMLYGNPWLTSTQGQVEWRTWIEVTVWGGTLIVTAYLMGTLYDHKSQQVQDLEESYDGIGHILQDFINRDHYRESHAYRSAMYASRIAAVHDMDARSIKNVHAAAPAERHRHARKRRRLARAGRPADGAPIRANAATHGRPLVTGGRTGRLARSHPRHPRVPTEADHPAVGYGRPNNAGGADHRRRRGL